MFSRFALEHTPRCICSSPFSRRACPRGLILLQTCLRMYRTVRKMRILISFLNQSSGSLTRNDILRFAYSTFCLLFRTYPHVLIRKNRLTCQLRLHLEVHSHVHKETFHIANELEFVFSHSPSYYSRTFRTCHVRSIFWRARCIKYPTGLPHPKT